MAKTVKKTKKGQEPLKDVSTVPAAQETPSAETHQEAAQAVIYVGPPIRGTLLHSTFIIFADGIPEEYRQHPIFKHLFVPPARLDQARMEIGKTGSLRNTYYQRAVKESKAKGGK